MGKVATLNYFGAIPGRASCDARLTGLHFRVLMVVAGHDRMGRNGQCCWAGRKKLASRAGCHPSSLSTAISELTQFGYLTEECNPEDGRKKGFRVVYEAELDAAGIGIDFDKSRLPVENLSDRNRSPIENLSAVAYQGNSEQKQYDNSTGHKPNILRRNIRYKSEDPKYGLQKRPTELARKLYGPNTHATIVQALGPDGWGILQRLPQATVEYLEQRVTDSLLNSEDLLRACHEARETAHG